jgi:hypothetical protein
MHNIPAIDTDPAAQDWTVWNVLYLRQHHIRSGPDVSASGDRQATSAMATPNHEVMWEEAQKLGWQNAALR